MSVGFWSLLLLSIAVLCSPYQCFSLEHMPVSIVICVACLTNKMGWADLWVWIIMACYIGSILLIAVILTAVVVSLLSYAHDQRMYPWAGLLITSVFFLRSIVLC